MTILWGNVLIMAIPMSVWAIVAHLLVEKKYRHTCWSYVLGYVLGFVGNLLIALVVTALGYPPVG